MGNSGPSYIGSEDFQIILQFFCAEFCYDPETGDLATC